MALSLRLRHLAALLLLAVAMFRPGQHALPPIDRDEPRYAEATMQMIETGDYLEPRFLDQPRYLQPAGIYWLQSAAVRLFGDPPAREIWAHRLVSLAAGMLDVALAAWIGARLFGRRIGWFAGVLLASSLLLGFESRIATIDATLLVVILAAQAALAEIYLARDQVVPPRRGPAVVFWVAIGLGVMLKGPVIALVVFSTMAALAISERRSGWMRDLRPLWGIPLALAIILPWFVAIGIASDGDFFARSIGQNFLGKVASGQQAHGAPPGYYFALFTLTFGPASLVAVLAGPRIWVRRREPAVRFCLCWIVPTWIVFELVRTKLPHYVLPTYPAIAILTASAIAAPWTATVRPWLRRAYLAYAACWFGALALLAAVLPAALWRMEGAVSPASLLLSASIVTALWLLLREVRQGRIARGRPGPALVCAAAASLLWSIDAYAIVLPRLSAFWIAPRVAALVAAVRPCPDSALASGSFSEPSLPYLLGTRTVVAYVHGSAAHIVADPACALALIGEREDAAFRADLAAAGLLPRVLGRVRGIDPVTGRRLDLTLFAADRPAG